jgi:hypothetical protein
MSDLPTKPGPYYWRESDGDEWEIHTVFIDDELNHTLMALCPIDETWYATENWGGQWLPIPAAEELVELQAAKKMVDDWNSIPRRSELVELLRLVKHMYNSYGWNDLYQREKLVMCAETLRKEMGG